jgi:hypothetical protein
MGQSMTEDEYLWLLRRSIDEMPPRLFVEQPGFGKKSYGYAAHIHAIERRRVCEQCGKGFVRRSRPTVDYYVAEYCSAACRAVATQVPGETMESSNAVGKVCVHCNGQKR